MKTYSLMIAGVLFNVMQMHASNNPKPLAQCHIQTKQGKITFAQYIEAVKAGQPVDLENEQTIVFCVFEKMIAVDSKQGFPAKYTSAKRISVPEMALYCFGKIVREDNCVCYLLASPNTSPDAIEMNAKAFLTIPALFLQGTLQ